MGATCGFLGVALAVVMYFLLIGPKEAAGTLLPVQHRQPRCVRRLRGWHDLVEEFAPDAHPAFRACGAYAHACIQVQAKEEEERRGRQIAEIDMECFDEVFDEDSQAAQLHRASSLLYDIFPRHVARALCDGVGLIPERCELATVVFSDIVGFTEICSQISPEKVVDMLHRLYCQFDRLSMEFGIYKVETIGDAYMGVTNLVSEQSTDHAKRVAQFAREAVQVANCTLVDMDNARLGCISIRVGFDSGPVMAGVVGGHNRRYCLFGDTVNTASRMESASVANHILCTERAAKVVREQAPQIPVRLRGTIPVKGKGELAAYWVKLGFPSDVQ